MNDISWELILCVLQKILWNQRRIPIIRTDWSMFNWRRSVRWACTRKNIDSNIPPHGLIDVANHGMKRDSFHCRGCPDRWNTRTASGFCSTWYDFLRRKSHVNARSPAPNFSTFTLRQIRIYLQIPDWLWLKSIGLRILLLLVFDCSPWVRVVDDQSLIFYT